MFFFAVLCVHRHHAVSLPRAPRDFFFGPCGYWWPLGSCLTYLTSQGVKVSVLVFLAEVPGGKGH